RSGTLAVAGCSESGGNQELHGQRGTRASGDDCGSSGNVEVAFASESGRAHSEKRASASGRTGGVLGLSASERWQWESDTGRRKEGRRGPEFASEFLGLPASAGLEIRGDDSGLRECAASERTGL